MDFKTTTQEITDYFEECSQEELIAWGVMALGLVMLVVGLILLI